LNINSQVVIVYLDVNSQFEYIIFKQLENNVKCLAYILCEIYFILSHSIRILSYITFSSKSFDVSYIDRIESKDYVHSINNSYKRCQKQDHSHRCKIL